MTSALVDGDWSRKCVPCPSGSPIAGRTLLPLFSPSSFPFFPLDYIQIYYRPNLFIGSIPFPLTAAQAFGPQYILFTYIYLGYYYALYTTLTPPHRTRSLPPILFFPPILPLLWVPGHYANWTTPILRLLYYYSIAIYIFI